MNRVVVVGLPNVADGLSRSAGLDLVNSNGAPLPQAIAAGLRGLPDGASSVFVVADTGDDELPAAVGRLARSGHPVLFVGMGGQPRPTESPVVPFDGTDPVADLAAMLAAAFGLPCDAAGDRRPAAGPAEERRLDTGEPVAAQGAPLARPAVPAAVTATPAPAAAGPRGKIIAVSAPKGGTGKSTVSLTLASFLGHALDGSGKRVCFLDANLQQADAAGYLMRNGDPDLSSLRGAGVDAGTVGRAVVHVEDHHLWALFGPADRSVAHPADFTPGWLARVAVVLAGEFDYVVIDTPVAERYHRMFNEFVLPVADQLVVVVNPSQQTLHNAQVWLRTITDPVFAGGESFPAERVGVILNRAEEGIGCDVDDVEAMMPQWRFLGAIPESPDFRAAANEGRLLIDDGDLVGPLSSILWALTGEAALEETDERRGFGGWFRRRRR